jgi:hypothetical protein
MACLHSNLAVCGIGLCCSSNTGNLLWMMMHLSCSRLLRQNVCMERDRLQICTVDVTVPTSRVLGIAYARTAFVMREHVSFVIIVSCCDMIWCHQTTGAFEDHRLDFRTPLGLIGTPQRTSDACTLRCNSVERLLSHYHYIIGCNIHVP